MSFTVYRDRVLNEAHRRSGLCQDTPGLSLHDIDMYSDSSSSTSTESDENFPGYIPVPISEFSDMLPGDKTKLYQAYKGQLKVSAYINYGLLTVHIMMARHLKSKYKSTCDSYVKLSLVPDATHRTRCKTEIIHDTNNPLYDEKFSFELLDEDSPKRLFISVWHRDIQRSQCEFLGCMSFGVHHIQTKQKTVHGWYYLMNSELGRKKHLQVTSKKHLSERCTKNIPAVNQDVLWMEPCVLLIRRGKSGFGFTISGSCPVSVCRVDKGSSAEIAGLQPGDCIVRIDGLNVSRSTCDSVARIIRHCQKKLILEVQRPKKVHTSFQLENFDHSPRRPLSSCASAVNRSATAVNRSVPTAKTQWYPPAAPNRRVLEPVTEEPDSSGYEDYGWIDARGRHQDEEDVYVEPDQIRNSVLSIPRDPPALPPPNRPRPDAIDDMVVSPWKPSPGCHSNDGEDHDRYVCLDGAVRRRDTVDDSRYEWDYSDTRFDSGSHETDPRPVWIDSNWKNQPTNGQGSSSGYSSATLPRSMKFGRKSSSSQLSQADNCYPTKRIYPDDVNCYRNPEQDSHRVSRTEQSSLRERYDAGYYRIKEDTAFSGYLSHGNKQNVTSHSSTGLGAHGDHGNRERHHQPEDRWRHQDVKEDIQQQHTETVWIRAGSSATLPKKKRVSFNVNRQSDV